MFDLPFKYFFKIDDFYKCHSSVGYSSFVDVFYLF